MHIVKAKVSSPEKVVTAKEKGHLREREKEGYKRTREEKKKEGKRQLAKTMGRVGKRKKNRGLYV